MQTSNVTTVTGAALGSAVGVLVVWLIEALSKVDAPTAVEGALVIICTALVSLIYPATR